jgi:hypothetical protein
MQIPHVTYDHGRFLGSPTSGSRDRRETVHCPMTFPPESEAAVKNRTSFAGNRWSDQRVPLVIAMAATVQVGAIRQKRRGYSAMGHITRNRPAEFDLRISASKESLTRSRFPSLRCKPSPTSCREADGCLAISDAALLSHVRLVGGSDANSFGSSAETATMRRRNPEVVSRDKANLRSQTLRSQTLKGQTLRSQTLKSQPSGWWTSGCRGEAPR